MAAKSSKCPYCGQPLVNETAVKHLQRERGRLEAKVETKLRRELTREANAAAKKKADKEVEAAKRKADKQIEAAEKRIRDEVGREDSRQRDALQRKIDKLLKHNHELERSLAGMNAPELGEADEAETYKRLKDAFPEDEITREGKGGDIVQVVQDKNGDKIVEAGRILYEVKNTKVWQNKFVDQIRADGNKRNTPYLVLVSRTLPKDVKDAGGGFRGDVIVANLEHAPILARILRRVVIETSRAKLAGRDIEVKTAQLYEYLQGDDFREEFASVVEAGSRLSAMLDKERHGHELEWARRKSAYDDLVHNSVAIDEAIREIIESDAPPPKAARQAKSRRPRDHSHAARV